MALQQVRGMDELDPWMAAGKLLRTRRRLGVYVGKVKSTKRVPETMTRHLSCPKHVYQSMYNRLNNHLHHLFRQRGGRAVLLVISDIQMGVVQYLRDLSPARGGTDEAQQFLTMLTE